MEILAGVEVLRGITMALKVEKGIFNLPNGIPGQIMAKVLERGDRGLPKMTTGRVKVRGKGKGKGNNGKGNLPPDTNPQASGKGGAADTNGPQAPPAASQ